MNSTAFSSRLFYTAVNLIFILVGYGCVSEKNEETGKPNIILIMIDNVGYAEFGVNGNSLVKTTHLDQFAREGVRFSRFYSNPMCAPTRASLMTGWYFYRTGVVRFVCSTYPFSTDDFIS